MQFGERLKLLLQVKGVKQRDFAKEIGVNECVVSRWLKQLKQPRIKYLNKICNYLGVSLDVLMGNTPLVDELLQRYAEGLIK